MMMMKRAKSVNYEELVQEYFQTLQDKIENFNSRVDRVLTLHEQDFMNAFKTHMTEIQKQLNQFKSFSTLEQERNKRDKEVQELRQSLEWFKHEAERLDEALIASKQETARWKAKSLAAEEDCKFMMEQLRTAKRENVVWKQRNDRPVKMQSAPITSPALKQIVETPQKADKTQGIVQHYQKTLTQERRKLRNLSALTSQALERRSELEGIFLDCVTEVRKAVNRRRPQSRATTFAVTDKKQILELLLNNDKVLTLVYEHLFPQRKPDFNFTAASPNSLLATSEIKRGKPFSLNESLELIV
jgi:uncharacterized phage infection (PIP) family protein YhgE